MIPGEFEYYSPSTLQEAIALLHEHGDDAKLLAGGQSLIPAMRFRLALPEVIIDINNIDGLEYVRESNGHLAIGAMTLESDLEESDLVQQKKAGHGLPGSAFRRQRFHAAAADTGCSILIGINFPER